MLVLIEGHNNWGYRMTDCVLIIGTTLAPKVFVMSQIVLVGPPLKTGFSTRYEENYTFSKKMWKLCMYIILHREAQTFNNVKQEVN